MFLLNDINSQQYVLQIQGTSQNASFHHGPNCHNDKNKNKTFLNFKLRGSLIFPPTQNLIVKVKSSFAMTCPHFLFTLVPLLCLLNVVKSTNFKGSFDTTGAGTLQFANPVSFHRHQLNSAPIESQEVEDEEGCVFACAKVAQCQSVNFKTVAEANGKFICHLLDADKFIFPELLNKSVEYHHYSFTVSQFTVILCLIFFPERLKALLSIKILIFSRL